MPGRTDTPVVGVPKRKTERLEVTGELELGCIVCHRQLPVKETVLFWRIGEQFVVACIDCGLPAREGS